MNPELTTACRTASLPPCRLPCSSPKAGACRCQPPCKAPSAVRWQRRRARSCAKALVEAGERKKKKENKIITHTEQPLFAGSPAMESLLVCFKTAPEHPENDQERNQAGGCFASCWTLLHKFSFCSMHFLRKS